MDKDFNNLDLLIKTGQANKAASLLIDLSKGQEKLSRSDRLALAKLARRAFIPQFGIKLLRPLVRPSDKKIIRPSDTEKVEYAANLSWLGALDECHSILDEVDVSKTPDALFIKGLALFREWRYAEAIPYLEKYISREDIGDYWKTIGKLNLMAAFAHEGLSTEELGSELEGVSRRENLSIVLANVFLFQTESYVQRGEYEAATRAINVADKQLEQGGMNTLFLNKWKAVVKLHQDRKIGLNELQAVRTEARLVKHWETLRDCDLQEIRYTNDLRKAQHLYFGTPHPAYREHLLKICPWVKDTIGSSYDLEMEGGSEEVLMAWEKTREGHVLQKLWEILQSDFYGSMSAGYLQSKLFPDKHFSLDRGSNSLHQALKRLRAFFEEQKISLLVHEASSEYTLVAQAPLTLRVRIADLQAPKIYLEQLKKMKMHFKNERFRARDVSYKLDLSRNMVLEYLRLWQKQGFIHRFGTGPTTTYRLDQKLLKS